MMNFNGQLKKRTVNLGGGFRNNRSNILLRTQKERERREKERIREKSIVLVQSYIRRHLSIIEYMKKVGGRWETIVENGNDINYITQQFNIFYSAIFNINERKLQHMAILCGVLQSSKLENLESQVLIDLHSTIINTLPQLSINNEVDLQILDKLLWLSQNLYKEVGKLSLLTGIISGLSDLVHSFINSRQFEYASKLVPTISLYSNLEFDNYIKFLAIPDLDVLSTFEIKYDVLNENIASSTILSSLSDDEKLTVLSNLITKAGSSVMETVSPISWVLSSMNFTVSTISEADFGQDDEDDLEESLNAETKRKIIDEGLNESIKKLYNRDFIAAVSKNTKDSRVLTRLYGSLIRLKPLMKSTFIIYMIPNSFESLVDAVVEHPVFKTFLQIQENSIYTISGSFIKKNFEDHMDFLQYDLYIFFEVFQYYLIVSNDFEIFKKYDFTAKKFEMIAIFLKNFTFSLIWNSSKIARKLENQNLDKLENLSTKVLNQIYLKDSRLSLLDKNLWLINDKRSDIMSLVQLIGQYEERKNEYESDHGDKDFLKSLSSESRAQLKVFLKTPFFISFEKRVEIFQLLVDLDREKLGLSDVNGINFSLTEHRQTAIIRREHMLEDAFESFNKLGETFKSKLSIIFTNEHGKEIGIDGGGLTKEFLTGVVKEGFKNLFVENDHHELYPNPQIGLKYQYRVDSEEQLQFLNHTNFLGKVIGKCLYERVLVDINFSGFFLTKFNTGYKNSFDDLKSLDSELYSNLVKLLGMSDAELEAMNLTFSVDEKIDNKNISIDLIPNGSIIPVNSSNKLKFIHEVSNFKLNKLMNIQCNSFLNGLFEMISKEWLSMFNPYELQKLISGEKDVNIDDLKENVEYGGYRQNDQTILEFWEIVDEMTSAERFQLVKFVTSVPRAPLLGFKALVPRFGINNSGTELDRLPTASTCVNLLKLPNYRNKGIMKKKLLYAINAKAGFDLS